MGPESDGALGDGRVKITPPTDLGWIKGLERRLHLLADCMFALK